MDYYGFSGEGILRLYICEREHLRHDDIYDVDDAGDGVDDAAAADDEDDVHLQCEGVDEVSSLAEVQAVQADEPVGGRDQLCQEGDLVMMMMNDSDVDLI